MPTKTVRCSSITLPCKCGLGPERLSGCGTAVVETAPSSVSGFRAPGRRGLASTLSLAGLVSAGNSDIQGRPVKHVQRAQIILLSAERLPVLKIAKRVGVSRPMVWRWQQRFAEEGIE